MGSRYFRYLLICFFLATCLEAQTRYSFNSYDNFRYSEDLGTNQFFGNWGPLVSEYVTLEIEKEIHVDSAGNSLRVEFRDLPVDGFTGIWQSLWRHSDSLKFSIDLAQFDSLEFYVRGSGLFPGQVYRLKVELKDNRPKSEANDFKAFRYVIIYDDSTNWKRIAFTTDVSNGLGGWQFVQGAPRVKNMKEFAFVIEKSRNPYAEGAFYLDNIAFLKMDETPFAIAGKSDAEFLEHINEKAFRYFHDLAYPDNGLIPDRPSFSDLYSVAACGFGLSAYAIAAHNGWLAHDQAELRVIRMLRTFDTIQLRQAQNPRAYGVEGFFYHFLTDKATRKDSTELSTVDTAVLLFGAISAGEYFGGEAKQLADSIFARVNWAWFRNLERKQFYLGWKPEFQKQTVAEGGFEIRESVHNGYFSGPIGFPATWDYTTDEVILLSCLAIASPRQNISRDVFYSWRRELGAYKNLALIQTWPGSLFTYFFAHCWLPFEALGPELKHPEADTSGINWFDNSKKAAQANRQYCIDNPDGYATYHKLSWGLTACESGPWLPPRSRYRAWGAYPLGDPNGPASNGTIAPYGAAGCILFMPGEVIETLKWYYEKTNLWHPLFGFVDAYNASEQVVQFNGGVWYSFDYFGIDVGPALIMIDNYLNAGFIQNQVMKNINILNALSQITSVETKFQRAEAERFQLHQNYPNPFNPSTQIRYSLSQPEKVAIKIYNTLGMEIATLFEGFKTAGEHIVKWDGKDRHGEHVTSGVYFYEIQAGDFVTSRKMLFLR